MARPTPEQVQRVKSLLAARGQAIHDATGIKPPRYYYPPGTFAAIARLTDVKAEIVSQIAHGTYSDRPIPRPDGPPIHQNQQAAAAVRCPGCGGMVYPPCLLCEANGIEPRA